MDPFMIFAMARLSKLFVTMITRKWLFTSMGPFMVPSMAGFFKCFFAIIARIWSSSYKDLSMSLIGKSFRCDTYKKIILMRSVRVKSKDIFLELIFEQKSLSAADPIFKTLTLNCTTNSNATYKNT